MSTATRLLDDDIVSAIRALFPRYPTRQAVTLPALHLVSARLGFVPPQAVVEIAEALGLSPAQVQDTISFYGYFKQDRPLGRVRVWVCRSLSCAARGGEDLLTYLCEKLSVRPGETTADGTITLEFAECLGACEGAPAVLAGEELCACMSREKADALIDRIRKGASFESKS